MTNVYLDFKNSTNAGAVYTNLLRYLLSEFGESNLTETKLKKYILENYGGVYVVQIKKNNTLQKHYIRFSDPKDLTAFLLRFS